MFGGVSLLLTGVTQGADPAIFSETENNFTSELQLVSATAENCAPACVKDSCAITDSCCATDDSDDCCSGRLQGLFDDCCGNNWLADHGISLGGWTEVGLTFNGDRPANKSNAPVGANDISNGFMLNQFYFQLSKDAATNADCYGLGFQVDLLVGHDSNFTTATGLDNTWAGNDRGGVGVFGTDKDNIGIAMPQMYASFYAPIGNGVTVNVGHFYKTIGYEVVTAPDNFFYSHAYTMMYSEPFTHTGVLASSQINDNVSWTSGLTTGWDDFSNKDGTWSYLGGFTFTADDELSSLAFAVSSGTETTGAVLARDEDTRTIYSIVYTRQLTDCLTYVFQHDNGRQEKAFVNGDGNLENAHWYGINQYLFYDLTDNTKAGIRAEWWRDDDGFRLGGDGNYYNVTAGLNWNISDCLIVRPEVRWDWADNGLRPYDDGSDGSQFTVGSDLILSY